MTWARLQLMNYCSFDRRRGHACNTAVLEVVERILEETRSSGFSGATINRAGVVGVDVAPPRAQQVR